MKHDMSPMLLMIMQKLLQEFPKYNYCRVQAWQYPAITAKSHTLKLMIEVTVADEA